MTIAVSISRIILTFVALLVVTDLASGQTPSVEPGDNGVVLLRDATPDTVKTLYSFIRQTQNGSDAVERLVQALFTIAKEPTFDAIFKSPMREPVVTLMAIGNLRRVVVLRQGYGNQWLDPTDPRLGRARAFWVIYVSDRPAEVNHSIVVRTQPVHEFNRQLEFDAPTVQAADNPDVGGDLSIAIGMKRFRVPHSPSTQAVTFRSIDLISGQVLTDEHFFRGFSWRIFDWDGGILIPLTQDSQGTRAILIGSIGFGSVRDRVLGGDWPGINKWWRTAFLLYPNFVFGVGLPVTLEDDDETYYFGFEWPIRSTPLGINIGRTRWKPQPGGADSPDKKRDKQWSFGLSISIGRTINMISGR